MLSVQELIKNTCQDVRRIDADTAFKELVGNDGLVIDVREPSEVSNTPVAGSINIPRGILEMKISEVYEDDSQPIYIHCASGARATLAALQLQNIGFTNVTAISSGLDDLLKIMEDCP